MSEYEDFIKRVKEVLSYPVSIANIIGIMGSGKTNWANYLSLIVEDIYPKKFLKFYIRYTNMRQLKRKMGFLAKSLRSIDRKLRRHFGLLIVFDDISFLKRDIEFLQKVANIRHYKGYSYFRKYFLIFAYHYSKGCLPFLRQSHIRVLTSLTTRYEIEQLKEYFDLNDLWNFYELKMSDIKRYRFHSLTNIMGKHVIVKPPLSIDKELIVVPSIKEKKKEEPKVPLYSIEHVRTSSIFQTRYKKDKIYFYLRTNGELTNVLTLRLVK